MVGKETVEVVFRNGNGDSQCKLGLSLNSRLPTTSALLNGPNYD